MSGKFLTTVSLTWFDGLQRQTLLISMKEVYQYLQSLIQAFIEHRHLLLFDKNSFNGEYFSRAGCCTCMPVILLIPVWHHVFNYLYFRTFPSELQWHTWLFPFLDPSEFLQPVMTYLPLLTLDFLSLICHLSATFLYLASHIRNLNVPWQILMTFLAGIFFSK
jgi:hypothetical protein